VQDDKNRSTINSETVIIENGYIQHAHSYGRFDQRNGYDWPLVTLSASSGKRTVMASVHPSVCLSVPSAHTQHDSPGDSTRRGKRIFPSEYYQKDILVIQATKNDGGETKQSVTVTYRSLAKKET